MNYGTDLLATGIKMIGAMAIVMGGMFIVFRCFKKYLNPKISMHHENLIRLLGSRYVGLKKTISLVEIPGAVLVLGITNDNITLLSRIEDEKIMNAMRSPERKGAENSFFDQFQKIARKANKKDPNP